MLEMNGAPHLQPNSEQSSREFGLIGHPLGHSFSARFFAEKFQKEQIDATYQNFDIEEAAQLMDIISSHPLLQGVNVTIPHKQAILPLLNDISDEARAIGAVNVVRISRDTDGTPILKGYNSDVIGFCQSLRPLLRPHHRKALVLGTGGASKAVVYGLKRLGITSMYVSRTPKEGQFTYDDLTSELLQEFTVIVNCTPLGMYPHIDHCPNLPYASLTAQHLLYDLVYNPEETLFLKKGAEHGATTKNGLEMLHLQALASWDFWNE